MNRFLLWLLFAFLTAPAVRAQYRPWKYWEDRPGTLWIAAEAGATRYAGDMSEERDLFVRPRLGATCGVSGVYRFDERMAIRADLRGYMIWGMQRSTRVWFNNLSFAAVNPELCVGVQTHLFPPDQRDRILNPYLFVGVGLTYLNTFTRYQNKWIGLAKLRTENVAYNRTPPILKLALGHHLITRFKYRIAAEFAYTVVFSDYLDDVSSVYADVSDREPIVQALADRRYALGLGLAPALPGDQRGNSVKRDGYFSFTLRFSKQLATAEDRQYRRVIGW